MLLAAALAWFAALAGCQAQAVRTAPFRQRPDVVWAGDLRGPFDGQVLEAASGKPIAGALVYATWTLEAGYGMSRPNGFHEFVANTDADGRYTIPALARNPGDRGTRVTDFYLVIYKRGYVAYRSDRRFSDLGPRRSFAQVHNVATLERWRQEYSHARHVRYIGGGPAIAALTAWETEEAAAELLTAGQKGERSSDITPVQTRIYIVAAQLLTADDIKRLTGFDGDFETGPLGDEPDTANYSSQHLKALNLPESYDVALRVWRHENDDEATKRYAGLMESLPNIEERNEIAERSLRTTERQIFGIAFLDTRRKVVVLMTCGQSQCDSTEVAARLGQKIHRRIEELWPLGAKQ